MIVERPRENIKVCAVLVLCERSEVLPLAPEHRECPAWSVTVRGRQEQQCPSSDYLIPGMWSRFLLG